jgi:hypothetical protein
MAETIQIKGSFYHAAGRKAAVAETVRRVAQGRVNGSADVGLAPRIAYARKLGVRLLTTPDRLKNE